LSDKAVLHPNSGLIGDSEQIRTVRRLIGKAARHRLPVLLLGESGSGKEVVARAIYEENPQGRFVPIDCGSLVGTLMESELFGHAKGSFSGATENKKGLVELADGGTAFFDEIGDLPLEMQVKLLRLLQEKEFRAVGSLQWKRVDLRIIAATHRDLKAEVAHGRFRLDLYYRLNVFPIRLPPLRERKEDIPLLIDHFLRSARESGSFAFRPSAETFAALSAYDWPGNVRELKHCIDRMAAMSSPGAAYDSLPSALDQARGASTLEHWHGEGEDEPLRKQFHPRPSTVISIPESEKQAISRALAATHGKRGRAAAILGIGRTTLYRKMKQYNLGPTEYRSYA
jgi:DNA-binding NtrC family response regulator